MAPILSYGSLASRKKSELLKIAEELGIEDHGTRGDLQRRIKDHLNNQELDRRADDERPSSGRTSGRRAVPEKTPVKDLRDVSTFLKHPPSLDDISPAPSPQTGVDAVPPSQVRPASPLKQLIQHIQNPPNMSVIVGQMKKNEIVQSGNEAIGYLRAFLSNSCNIWTITATLEFLSIIYSVVPWNTLFIPRKDGGSKGFSAIVYPSLSAFRTTAFWLVMLHWALPTLLLPAVVGHIISFRALHAKSTPGPSTGAAIFSFDPLTSSIVRLAAQIAYPFPELEHKFGVVGLDVLGYKWRVMNASVGLALAFAEAIAATPQTLASVVASEQRKVLVEYKLIGDPSSRPTILARGESLDSEVD